MLRGAGGSLKKEEAKARFGLAHGSGMCYHSKSMKIRLSTLREGANPLDETLYPGDLGLDGEIFAEPVLARGEAVDGPHLVDVRLTLETKGRFLCSRCANEFIKEIRAQLRVEVLKREPADVLEEEAEGVLFAGMHCVEVDLGGEVMDALMLEVPLQPLCREDCRGLCPFCYRDLNEGPCEHAEGTGGAEDPGCIRVHRGPDLG